METSTADAGSCPDPDDYPFSAVAEPENPDDSKCVKAESHVGSQADPGVMEAGDLECGDIPKTFTEADWRQDKTTLIVGDWNSDIACTGRTSLKISIFGVRRNDGPELERACTVFRTGGAQLFALQEATPILINAVCSKG